MGIDTLRTVLYQLDAPITLYCIIPECAMTTQRKSEHNPSEVRCNEFFGLLLPKSRYLDTVQVRKPGRQPTFRKLK